MRALCEIAYKLSLDPHDVARADWDRLRALGFSDEDCLEVAHVVGIFNHLTRLADGFGIPVDPRTLAAARGGAPLRRPAPAGAGPDTA
jgi:alkylhydroperoxidase family enzyme